MKNDSFTIACLAIFALLASVAFAAVILTINLPNADYVTVWDTTTISVGVSGDTNATPISKIIFYIDNRSNSIGEDSTSPYSIDWDTTPYYDSSKFSTRNGKWVGSNYHTIIASAVKSDGTEIASANRIVNVSNQSNVIPTPANYTCTDSDGGKDTSVKGNVTAKWKGGAGGASVNEYDSCDANGRVVEKFCKASTGRSWGDVIGTETIACQSGYTCSGGKCVQTLAEPQPTNQTGGTVTGGTNFTCTDSDGGKDTTVSGTVTIGTTTVPITYKDYCVNTRQITEYFCKAAAVSSKWINDILDSETSDCPSNYTCSSGRCAQAVIQPSPQVETTTKPKVAEIGKISETEAKDIVTAAKEPILRESEITSIDVETPKAVVTGKKRGKLLGIFDVDVAITIEIDKVTLEQKVSKPWWVFLVLFGAQPSSRPDTTLADTRPPEDWGTEVIRASEPLRPGQIIIVRSYWWESFSGLQNSSLYAGIGTPVIVGPLSSATNLGGIPSTSTHASVVGGRPATLSLTNNTIYIPWPTGGPPLIQTNPISYTVTLLSVSDTAAAFDISGYRIDIPLSRPKSITIIKKGIGVALPDGTFVDVSNPQGGSSRFAPPTATVILRRPVTIYSEFIVPTGRIKYVFLQTVVYDMANLTANVITPQILTIYGIAPQWSDLQFSACLDAASSTPSMTVHAANISVDWNDKIGLKNASLWAGNIVNMLEQWVLTESQEISGTSVRRIYNHTNIAATRFGVEAFDVDENRNFTVRIPRPITCGNLTA